MDIQQLKALKAAIPDFGDHSLSAESAHFEADFLLYQGFYGFEALAGLYDDLAFGYINSGDYRVACMRWTQHRAHAQAVVVHGLFDHVGLYIPVIECLLKQGLNVVAFDLPEHGLSSGREGELTSFSVYVDALDTVISALCKDDGHAGSMPLYALGQSTGAAVIMNHILRRQQSDAALAFDKLVLLAPLLRVVSWQKIRISYQILHRFIKRVPRDFLINSHDTHFHTFLKEQDPCQPKSISVPWVKAMLDWDKAFCALRQSEIPGVLVQGTQDQTVDAAFNLPRILSKFPNLKVSQVEGAYHHLVREADPWRSEVFEAIKKEVTL